MPGLIFDERAYVPTAQQQAFDLWSHSDVQAHQDAILERLRNGTMPCDGAWPPEHVAVFQRWIASGSAP
jgi:hypothetical protein